MFRYQDQPGDKYYTYAKFKGQKVYLPRRGLGKDDFRGFAERHDAMERSVFGARTL